MEKLTLKEIAGYLPYDLEGLITYSDESTDKCILSIKNGLNGKCDINDFINGTYPIKPLLYPLEMLTKTIVHNGVEIIPIDEIAIYKNVEYLIEQIKLGFVEVIIYQKLLEWNFDVFGLLERNLAINKSTLNSK